MIDITAEYGIGDEFFNYIDQHIDSDTTRLLLSAKDCKFDLKFAILQIECRKQIAKKVPALAALKHFIYPTSLSTEQCTCQVVAKFHASLLSWASEILDLTAGLGIDDYYIAAEVKYLTSVEKSPIIAAALRHNMTEYRSNITVVNDDACHYIANAAATARHFDAIFIDPARRDKLDRRTYGLQDCEPDVMAMLDHMKSISRKLYIKASPMLDITQLAHSVPHLVSIYVVGVDNECKEVLLCLDFNAPALNTDVAIKTINFENSGESCQELDFSYNDARELPVSYNTDVLSYIYEPNCCIMKSGAFPIVSREFPQLFKLGPSTHMFTSETLYNDFPGRKFSVIETIPFKERYIKQLAKRYPKANISTRNFKLKPQEIKKKLKIQDGGDIYIFAVTLQDKEQNLIITRKII